MKMIDADALIECIKDELYYTSDYWYKLIADALIKCINDQPTIKAYTATKDLENLQNDIECLRTVEDSLRMVDDEMTLCMMRIDDIQRAINQGIFDIILMVEECTQDE